MKFSQSVVYCQTLLLLGDILLVVKEVLITVLVCHVAKRVGVLGVERVRV